jgi:uncharacterized protein YoxC
MDQTINPAVKEPVKRTGTGRNNRKAKGTTQVSQIDETTARLNTHEQVCAERYKAIEGRMDTIETRVDAISTDVKELKQTNDRQFNEIKALIERRQSGSHQAIITAAGTIIVALIGFLGYLLTHIK